MSAINKILDPKNDFAFKKIVGTEQNEDILIHWERHMCRYFSQVLSIGAPLLQCAR